MKLVKDLIMCVKFTMRHLMILVPVIHMINIFMITKYFLVIWILGLICLIMKFVTWLCKKITKNCKSTISFLLINTKTKSYKTIKKDSLTLILLINMIETATFMILLQKWGCQHGVIEFWCAEILNSKKT
jgi:hypothetical protein